MKPVRRRLAAVAGAAGLALVASASVAPSASATIHKPLGTKSLASVLLADTSGFDTKGRDFDVLKAAVLAVLEAKPNSPVKVLTDGNVALTAFLPTDNAFAHLVKSLTGAAPKSEQASFQAVAGLGIDTVETVLLYHVVPGKTITAKQAAFADGVKLTTAQGGTVTVDVSWKWFHPTIALKDKDPNFANAIVAIPDINKGNKQIAHGVTQVLRPLDLPPTYVPDPHPHH